MAHNGTVKTLPGTIPDKLQPHDVEAEEALLGALLIDEDRIVQLAPRLDKDLFYIHRNGHIWQAIANLHERRAAVNLVTLCDELGRMGKLKEVGGASYITGLISGTPTSLHAEHYADIVIRTSFQRRLIDTAGEISRMAWSSEEANPVDISADAEKIWLRAIKSLQADETVDNMALMGKVGNRLEQVYSAKSRGIIGLPTGLTDLDRLLGGLQRSNLIMIAGRPGMGKSALALNIAMNAAEKHLARCLIFSLEMSDEELGQRQVAMRSGVDLKRLRNGQIKEDEWAHVLGWQSHLADLPIYIDDTPAITPGEIRNRAMRVYAEKGGLDLIIVDYLQLMSGGRRSQNREQEISLISRSLKALARELNIPVIALSQLNRAVENRHDKHPTLADLRESGALEQDSDIVMFIYRDDYYDKESQIPGIAELIIAKFRSGPTGTVRVFFKKALTRFADLAEETTSLEWVK